MKNLSSYLMMGVVVATTFFSCNQSDEITPDTPDKQIIQENDLIKRNILNLSTDDAFKLAKRFYKDEYAKESRTASVVNIKDIQTVTSASGEPLMYIVNYADNNGYAAISATKNYVPILAYSEKGYIDTQNRDFKDNPFFNKYKSQIESVFNIENDSLRQKYAINWSFYEEKTDVVESRSYTDAEIQQKLAAARTYYTNQGYNVHSLGAITSLMTGLNGQTAEQRANAFINDICSRIPAQYDCMDVTLLLYKRTDEIYGYYLNTSWNQGEPYSYGSTNGKAGCNTIAIGQMMNFYEWPETYDWYNIHGDKWIGSTNDLHPSRKTLISDIRSALNLVERPDGVVVSKPNMVNALTSLGYLVEQQVYTELSMINKIKSGIPVMVYGQNETNHTDVHVWICDGYRNIETQYAVYMMSPDFEDFTFFPGTTDHFGEFFHLNLGTGVNGWYYIEEVPYGENNYVDNRVMYTLTKNHSLYD